MKRISIRDHTIHKRCLQAASSQRERRLELGGVVMFAHVSWMGISLHVSPPSIGSELLLPSAHQLKLLGRTFRLIQFRNWRLDWERRVLLRIGPRGCGTEAGPVRRWTRKWLKIQRWLCFGLWKSCGFESALGWKCFGFESTYVLKALWNWKRFQLAPIKEAAAVPSLLDWLQVSEKAAHQKRRYYKIRPSANHRSCTTG